MTPSVTICIPHKDTPDLLRAIVPLWKRQTVPVYLVVVDTGSKNLPRQELSDWRINGKKAIDLLQVSPPRKEFSHFGDVVASANQLVQDACFTDYIIFTHTDVFPRHPHVVENFLREVHSDVAGYRMSPRDHCNGFLGKSWRWMVGHSLLFCRTAALAEAKVSWSRLVAEKEFELKESFHPDNWDSEVTMNLCLRRAGIEPEILGSESNFERFEDSDIIHCRSATLSRMGYLGPSYSELCESWLAQEIENAHKKSDSWSKSSLTIFVPLSGRKKLWTRFSEQLNRLLVNCGARLVLLDTSQDLRFSETVQNWIQKSNFQDVQHLLLPVGQRGLADMDRACVVNEVQRAMAVIYGWLKENLKTEFAFIIEDDVIPPVDALLRLLQKMQPGIDSVSAVYPQKQSDCVFAWNWSAQGFEFLKSGSGCEQVGGNGFGCVLLRREAIKSGSFERKKFSDVDLQFYAELREKGRTCLIDWGARCEHVSV